MSPKRRRRYLTVGAALLIGAAAVAVGTSDLSTGTNQRDGPADARESVQIPERPQLAALDVAPDVASPDDGAARIEPRALRPAAGPGPGAERALVAVPPRPVLEMMVAAPSVPDLEEDVRLMVPVLRPPERTGADRGPGPRMPFPAVAEDDPPCRRAPAAGGEHGQHGVGARAVVRLRSTTMEMSSSSVETG